MLPDQPLLLGHSLEIIMCEFMKGDEKYRFCNSMVFLPPGMQVSCSRLVMGVGVCAISIWMHFYFCNYQRVFQELTFSLGWVTGVRSMGLFPLAEISLDCFVPPIELCGVKSKIANIVAQIGLSSVRQ